ncbi:type II toxin-antitoxin system RelE/ParE family toxin (plasmid) [Acinetobacter sp. LF10]|uniref:type II toxin-antitoxin system RelE/ParE family toxin n=1 Tax=unclassified Acinetobacter TaxID=196816 RepID=UPI0022AC819A|nr:type II toxin-antitoxin system RelE/ParE family toxin [Acinetobacter sp. TR3]WAU78258.1 type II toxin-antitoxin system RelE/ParE family toxin [Acinetobacter sp. TR3]
MKVIFAKQAENDLEQIADFIAQDNPQRALSFILELEQKCLSIGGMPKAFPIVPELIELGIRRRVYQNYSIFFCITSGHIFIVRVLNSVMNYTALFES